jgi:hypothetical protein
MDGFKFWRKKNLIFTPFLHSNKDPISFQPYVFALCTMDLFTYFRPLVLETNKQHERKFSEVQ